MGIRHLALCALVTTLVVPGRTGAETIDRSDGSTPSVGVQPMPAPPTGEGEIDAGILPGADVEPDKLPGARGREARRVGRRDARTVRRVLEVLHTDNRLAIDLGRLAVAKAKSPRLRDFGALVARDHEVDDERVAALAAKKGLDPKRREDERLHELRQRFEATRAEQFDRVYLESIVVLHTNLVARVQAVRRRIEDADTRVLLEETLATLERHRLMADELLRDDDLGDLSG